MTLRKILCIAALPLLVPALGGPLEARSKRLTLRTVEGRVTATEAIEAEGGLPTLAVKLEVGGGDGAVTVVLAPKSSCDEIGFEVEAGDRLRARIFVDGPGPSKAHKAFNLTRGTMVRFRTLRSVPLWTAAGAWQGGGRGGHGASAGPPARRGAPRSPNPGGRGRGGGG